MKFNRRLTTNASPDLVPMIDVVFQLVVFFLMSSTFVVSPGIALRLPTSSTTEPVITEALNLYLYEDGRLFAGETSLDNEGLEALLADGTIPVETPVSLLAEAGTPYQAVISILDIVRRNGFSQVSLRAEVPDEDD